MRRPTGIEVRRLSDDSLLRGIAGVSEKKRPFRLKDDKLKTAVLDALNKAGSGYIGKDIALLGVLCGGCMEINSLSELENANRRAVFFWNLRK